MAEHAFLDALEDCIARMAAGDSIDACIARGAGGIEMRR